MSGALVRVDGLKDLEKMLTETLPKSMGKAVLRRVGKKSLGGFIQAAKAGAPVRTGDLRDSVEVNTRLSKRQARINRRAAKDGKDAVQIFAGASALPHAHLQEFGSANNPAHPFMRPAWEAEKDGVLNYIVDELGKEIDKTARRYAKKLAKKG